MGKDTRNAYADYEDKDFMHESAPKQYPINTSAFLVKNYGKDTVKEINNSANLSSDNKESKKV